MGKKHYFFFPLMKELWILRKLYFDLYKWVKHQILPLNMYWICKACRALNYIFKIIQRNFTQYSGA